MGKKIVIASTSTGKIKEFKEMFEPHGYQVLSLKDLPEEIDIDENGTTFAENAVIKAQSVTDRFGMEAIADDSGLEIDAFGGEPGVHSARWLGHDTPYTYKNQVILERMEGEQNRGCRYVCAIAWTKPDCPPVVIEDTVECTVAYRPAGINGFGYDPIVYYPPYGKTMAEMEPEEKHLISHRGKAVRRLEKLFDEKDC
ncbi:MAG: RdgB/HAM1 family non-canonical purine NTP pyrophosphatase [Solobacterium sp.]|nr:RdgB/HAM1 family non-canonical purine NTP pyrophosphatase [Solobacterium sp.]